MSQPRILVADDEEGIRELLRETLGATGYTTDEASDGAEAIDKIDQNSYDLVVLDINMPKKSGLDVLKHIRERGMKTGVIMLTGRLGFAVGSESMQLGADEYITKPFDPEYLQAAIIRVLEAGKK